MKFTKKFFKHGGSQAVVIPSEMTKHFPTKNVAVKFIYNKQDEPMIIITPAEDPELMEDDPLFAKFLQAIYNDAMKHPEKLKDLSDIFDEEADKLLEGVDIHED